MSEVAAGCPVNAAFDPRFPAYLDDPYAIMAAVTRYADIAQIFDDPATYSAAAAQAPLVPLSPEAQRILLDGGQAPQPSMVSLDEPAHARLRRPAVRAFAVKRVNDMVPTIRRVAGDLLDGVTGTGVAEFDLVGALAFPLPAHISFRGPQQLRVRTAP